MKRTEKADLISSLNTLLKDADGIFVVENNGLTVKQFESLRKELKPHVSLFKVVKNRLFKLATRDTNFSDTNDLMQRPTAIAIASDSLAVTKVLAAFAEKNPKLALVGGKMGADLLDAKGVEQLSKLPSLLEIRGTIARILVEPGSRLARVSAERGKQEQ
ncbi:MAG: 50S ribosomal protein L10 [Alphaproteobacteria bacterium]|nr:50S ribosomal protein L10 [Alphaproteobacteria bacterium]